MSRLVLEHWDEGWSASQEQQLGSADALGRASPPGRACLHDHSFAHAPGMLSGHLTSCLSPGHMTAGTHSTALPDHAMLQVSGSSHEDSTCWLLPAGTLRLPARRGS